MSYIKYAVNLSAGQREKLAKAFLNKSAITIRLTKSDLSGSDELMLTKTQLKCIQKAMNNGTGVDLKISKTQINHLVQKGGSLWSSLISLGAKTLPYATNAVTKVAPALATEVLQALGSLGIDKIFGKGQSGGFLIPQDKIDQLIQYKDLLTKKQKEQIVSAIHTGGQLVVKRTKTQSGGFLGTLLASIGIPLLMNALSGKGLQVDKKRSRRSANVHQKHKTIKHKTIKAHHQKMEDWFFQWITGALPSLVHGVILSGWVLNQQKRYQKKSSKKGQRSASRKKQSIQRHAITRSNSVKFVNKPLSNFDLLNWVKKLAIKHFRGVYSRDGLPKQIKKDECGIINLDSQIGPGTHWVAYRNGKNGAEYFDSFGLIMSNEVMKYLMTSGKQIFYSGDEIQERDSVLCGYWALYYLSERQKNVPMLTVIHNAKFNMNDQTVNLRFIIDYFKNIELIYMRSYCVKQKKVTECAPGSERYEKAKNGRLMLKCKCSECGITKTKFIKSQKGGENPLGKAFEATKFAEQLTRKMIPSTNHVFALYWSGDVLKGAFTGPTRITSKKFWTHPKKGTIMELRKDPKTGKYVNVYIEP